MTYRNVTVGPDDPTKVAVLAGEVFIVSVGLPPTCTTSSNRTRMLTVCPMPYDPDASGDAMEITRGATVSTVTLEAADSPLRLLAASRTSAKKACCPSLRVGVVTAQRPRAFAVVTMLTAFGVP